MIFLSVGLENPAAYLLVFSRPLTQSDISACASKILLTYQGGELDIAEKITSTNCLVLSD